MNWYGACVRLEVLRGKWSKMCEQHQRSLQAMREFLLGSISRYAVCYFTSDWNEQLPLFERILLLTCRTEAITLKLNWVERATCRSIFSLAFLHVLHFNQRAFSANPYPGADTHTLAPNLMNIASPGSRLDTIQFWVCVEMIYSIRTNQFGVIRSMMLRNSTPLCPLCGRALCVWNMQTVGVIQFLHEPLPSMRWAH